MVSKTADYSSILYGPAKCHTVVCYNSNMSDKEKIIYCAAILEGEGSFLKKSKNSMCVQCQMTDEDIILRLQEYLGGSVIKTNDRNPDKWKTVWLWAVYGNAAEEAARLVLPYMGKRRSEKINELLRLREEKAKFNSDVDNVAREYMLGKKSLRQLERETGFSRQTILRHKNKMEI